jgi:hypothetical protein
LAPLPWAQRLWAVPFLTVLAPSAHDHQQRQMRHKTVPEWERPRSRQPHRWLLDRVLVVVADTADAVLDLLAPCQRLPTPPWSSRACAWMRPSPIRRRSGRRGRKAAPGAQASASRRPRRGGAPPDDRAIADGALVRGNRADC